MAEPDQAGTEAAASGGLPQFDPHWWPGQIVWFSMIFLVVFVLSLGARLAIRRRFDFNG